MTSAELDNLVRIGKLKREPASARELEGLRNSALARLADSQKAYADKGEGAVAEKGDVITIDFKGTLNLSHLGNINLVVAGEYYGHLNTASPAHIQSLAVGGSVNAGSSISAQQIDDLHGRFVKPMGGGPSKARAAGGVALRTSAPSEVA